MEGLASLEKVAFLGGLWNAAKIFGRSMGFGAKQSFAKNVAGQGALGLTTLSPMSAYNNAIKNTKAGKMNFTKTAAMKFSVPKLKGFPRLKAPKMNSFGSIGGNNSGIKVNVKKSLAPLQTPLKSVTGRTV